jgi:predicted small secreted protein
MEGLGKDLQNGGTALEKAAVKDKAAE